MGKFAIIETGGKQYKVAVGEEVRVEKLDVAEGSDVVFDKVLLYVDGEKVQIGTPYVDGAKVEAKVSKQGREKKKIVFRYHSKTRYRKKKGHRQHVTAVRVQAVKG